MEKKIETTILVGIHGRAFPPPTNAQGVYTWGVRKMWVRFLQPLTENYARIKRYQQNLDMGVAVSKRLHIPGEYNKFILQGK